MKADCGSDSECEPTTSGSVSQVTCSSCSQSGTGGKDDSHVRTDIESVRAGMNGLNMRDAGDDRTAGRLTRNGADGPTASECLFLVLIRVDSSSLQ